MRAEIEMHIQDRVDSLLEAGKSAEQARKLAVEMFGDVDELAKECMDHGYGEGETHE